MIGSSEALVAGMAPRKIAEKPRLIQVKRECLLVFLTTFAILSTYFHCRVRDFFPTADDIIMITEATPYGKPVDFARWFTTGQSGLWRPFAEYSGTASDFIRPVIDACFFVNYFVWAERWGNYLYVNFVVMAGAATWTYYVCRQRLGLSKWIAAAGSGLILLNPATVNSYYSPISIVHSLSALIAATAILLVLEEHFLAAGFLFVVALFTKESTAFALAGGVVCLVQGWKHEASSQGRLIARAAMLAILPLAFFATVRLLVFHGWGHAYVTDGISFRSLMISIVSFPVVWPLGLTGPTSPENSLRAILLTHDWRHVAGVPLLGIVMNVLFVGVAVRAAWRYIREPAFRNQNQRLFWLASSLVLSLAELIVLGLPLQNGMFVFLAGIPLACLVLQRAFESRAVLPLAMTALYLLLLALPATMTLACEHTATAAAERLEERNAAVSFVDSLAEAGRKHARIYVLNDTITHSARMQIGLFAKTKADVVLLNNVLQLPHDDLSVTYSKIGPNRWRIVTSVKPPNDFYFMSVRYNELFRSGQGKSAIRNDHITYEFPKAQPARVGLLGTVHWSVGNQLHIELTDDSDFAVVDYDSATGRYRVAPLP